jgi:hypothetical protein
MKRFKHSGALGDLIYSLPIVKQMGGGEFYLHLNQMDWIGQHYYGSAPAPFHQGRMNLKDHAYMKTFMEAQEYITKFDVMYPTTEITVNLDRFRPAFVGHPTNYIELYGQTHGLSTEERGIVNTSTWLTVPNPRSIAGRPVVINRTERWIPPIPGPQWMMLKQQGMEAEAVFVGLEQEYQKFKEDTGWDIPWEPTETMLDLAEVIAGAEVFVGNQSQCFALAVGLGVEEIWCESRLDIPLERNECYFPMRPNIEYF